MLQVDGKEYTIDSIDKWNKLRDSSIWQSAKSVGAWNGTYEPKSTGSFKFSYDPKDKEQLESNMNKETFRVWI
jgi:hypothetical protein